MMAENMVGRPSAESDAEMHKSLTSLEQIELKKDTFKKLQRKD